MKSEEERLKKISKIYSSRKSFDKFIIKFGTSKILANAKGPNVLELGSADGLMTEFLSTNFKLVHVVEASPRYVKIVKNKKLKNVEIFNSLIEDFSPAGKYDDIILARILEHVVSPKEVLKKAGSWIKPGGRIHIIVPNADSLNRRIGQAMNIIKNRTDLDNHDLSMGHRRVYSTSNLAKEVKSANLKVLKKTGIFLKPLSNKQMLAWPKRLIEALNVVGEEFPELCTEIYFVVSKNAL